MSTAEAAETSQIRSDAVDAAQRVFDRALQLMAPPRHVIEEALDAAGEVYGAADDAEAELLMQQTGFAGMDVTGSGIRTRIKYAAAMLKAIVGAFDEFTRSAPNYIEQELTFTDPAAEEAIKAGRPTAEWPPRRVYKVYVVKPGRPTPHDLRKQAEAEVERLRGELERLHAGRLDPGLLRWCDWPGCWRSYNATTGPVGEPGWMRHPRPQVLLCPTHDPAGHRPTFDWTPGDDHITAGCQCGATDQVHPTNHQAVIDWWSGHIRDLEVDENGDTSRI